MRHLPNPKQHPLSRQYASKDVLLLARIRNSLQEYKNVCTPVWLKGHLLDQHHRGVHRHHHQHVQWKTVWKVTVYVIWAMAIARVTICCWKLLLTTVDPLIPRLNCTSIDDVASYTVWNGFTCIMSICRKMIRLGMRSLDEQVVSNLNYVATTKSMFCAAAVTPPTISWSTSLFVERWILTTEYLVGLNDRASRWWDSCARQG